ncbi:hypothetical protein DFH07DRAFT_913481 [Mycena maculata]|uniref:SET domain-containing protein n=1 Tax=Mycena maculata TaxID=230809 RepID=A0AAD7JXX0_9AGAR|nr:hypothetical protein DFH07DRAFT_913481 [Mycena maculata]
MRRGFLQSRKHEAASARAPYPTRNTKPDRDERRLFADDDLRALQRIDARGYTVKELRAWGRKNVRLSDDPCMSARVDLDEFGSTQRLIFRNIKLGTFEISTLLDREVLSMLPTRFSPPPTAMESAIEYRSAGRKGWGVFATQDIRAVSTILLVERPVTVVQNTMVMNFGMTKAEAYRELFGRVPASVQPALMRLNSSQPPGMYELEEAILRSNAVGITLPAPAVPAPVAMGHNAVFLETSRLNHSCSPNVIIRFDSESFALTVRTICPIAKGEEIVLSYIDLSLTATREERRSLLRDLCHFECLCGVCALSEAAIQLSDLRRLRIRDMTREAIYAPLEAWCREKGRGDLQKVIAFHLVAVEEIRVEGLYTTPYFLHVSNLAICFAALEDIRSFRSWMGKARDVAVYNLATDKAVEMLRNIVYPETFPWWGYCKSVRSSKSPV